MTAVRARDVLRTRLCDRLGIELPIVAAPMGASISGPELVAAVSDAGGLGILTFGGKPPALLHEDIARVRALTPRPFGVNFILELAREDQVLVAIEERVPVISFFWGDPSPYVARAHAAGSIVLHQIGTVTDARRAVAAGVDVVVAQGFEAGGHVAGQVGSMVLVPRVVDAVAPTLVIAAGGIADARGLVAALALGADGVSLGTRFLASAESAAHPAFKKNVLAASEEDTVHTMLFGGGWPNAPHRALRTPFVERWRGQEARGQEQRPDEPIIGETLFAGQTIPVQRFAALPPGAEATGEVESMAMLAGQSAGLVVELKPAAAIVREIAEGARRIIGERLARLV